MNNQYLKKQVPVKVDFAEKNGEIRTLEGKVTYQLGDALMTGIKGERWPIKREVFEKTYHPVAPLLMGASGQYIKEPIPVFARQVICPERIEIDNGILIANIGDWIVSAPDSKKWVVQNRIFCETYLKIS